MKEETIELVEAIKIPHHKLASEHREMSDKEFESLKLDIESNGQIMPVILYKGKLVDGRHRQRALIELGVHNMKAIRLAGNISLNDVRAKVMGTEVRRSDNIMQKAIRALVWMNEETGRTQQEAGTKFGIDRAYVAHAKKLLDALGKNTLDLAYRQGYLMVSGKKVSTMKTIIKMLSTKESEPTVKGALDDNVKEVFDTINYLTDKGDTISLTQIMTYAKKCITESIK